MSNIDGSSTPLSDLPEPDLPSTVDSPQTGLSDLSNRDFPDEFVLSRSDSSDSGWSTRSLQLNVLQRILVRILQDPKNALGLGGPAKGGKEWESWLDGLLEGGPVKDCDWGQKTVRPKRAREFVRSELIYLATRERAKIRTLAKTATLEITEGSTVAEIEHPRPRKRSAESNNPKPSKIRRLTQNQPSKPEPAVPGLVFATRLADTKRVKLVHAPDIPSLSAFIQRLRERWNLDSTQRIENIDFWLEEEVIEVNLTDERDWVFILDAAQRNGIFVVDVYITIKE